MRAAGFRANTSVNPSNVFLVKRGTERIAASFANESLKPNVREARQRMREEIDARVNDFPYARKRPRLSYIGEDKQHKSSRDARVSATYARERAREMWFTRV